jgi:hypothetical protein
MASLPLRELQPIQKREDLTMQFYLQRIRSFLPLQNKFRQLINAGKSPVGKCPRVAMIRVATVRVADVLCWQMS